MRELHSQLGDERPDLRYLTYPDSRAQFRYDLQLPPDEVADNISTSSLLAAWNAATYVAQVEDERLKPAMSEGRYLDVTSQVLKKYQGLWFIDESFNLWPGWGRAQSDPLPIEHRDQPSLKCVPAM